MQLFSWSEPDELDFNIHPGAESGSPNQILCPSGDDFVENML
jgi:hypothetical protein